MLNRLRSKRQRELQAEIDFLRQQLDNCSKRCRGLLLRSPYYEPFPNHGNGWERTDATA